MARTRNADVCRQFRMTFLPAYACAWLRARPGLGLGSLLRTTAVDGPPMNRSQAGVQFEIASSRKVLS